MRFDIGGTESAADPNETILGGPYRACSIGSPESAADPNEIILGGTLGGSKIDKKSLKNVIDF